jgi:hypothetical protein
MSNNWVVIIFILFMVLMMSLYLGSQDYRFFAFGKSSLSEYPYEGFADYQEAFDKRAEEQKIKKPINISAIKPPTFTMGTLPDFHSMFGPPRPQAPVVDPSGAIPPSNGGGLSDVFKKEGFETLTGSKPAKLGGSSYVAEQKPVAFLYNNDANTTCKNYGYTNSKGFICMSSSDIQLLTTRGGNAAGASDQIGK